MYDKAQNAPCTADMYDTIADMHNHGGMHDEAHNAPCIDMYNTMYGDMCIVIRRI